MFVALHMRFSLQDSIHSLKQEYGKGKCNCGGKLDASSRGRNTREICKAYVTVNLRIADP